MRWASWIGAGLVVAVLFFVFALPTPLARFLIASQLEGVGIASTGVQTIKLDLWNSEIDIGPIELWAEGSDPARIGSAALDYDLGALFGKEVLVEALVIEGVDVFVQRDEDGDFTFNGISPSQFLTQDDEAEAPEENDEAAWAAGVADLKIRNSQISLEDYTGGVLALEIEELVLKDLNTWTPNEGGDFEVKMALNEIGLEFEGRIRPFSDPIELSIEGGLRDATLPKVSRFTGALGLDREEGVLDSDLKREMLFHSDGRVEGASVGTITVRDVDLIFDDMSRLQLDKAEIEVDTSSTIFADDGFEYAGTIKGTLEKLAAGTADGSQGSAETIALAIEDFSVAQRGERRLPHDAPSAGATPAPASGAAAPSLISEIVLAVVEVVREILAHDLEFEALPSTKIEKIDITLSDQDGGPKVDLSASSLVASAPGVRAATVDTGWRIDGGLNGAVSEILSRVEQDGTVLTNSLGTLDLAAPRIEAQTGEADTVISFDVRTIFEDLTTSQSASGSAEAFDIAFESLETTTSGFEVRSDPQGQQAKGPIDLTLSALQAKVTDAEMTAEVGASGVVVALPSLALDSSTSSRKVALSGHTEVVSLVGSQTGAGGERELLIGTGDWKTDITGLNLEARDDGASVTAQFDTHLSTIEAQFGLGKINADAWQTDVDKLSVDTQGETLALTGELATALSGLQSEIMVETLPLDLALDQVTADLTSLNVVSSPDDLSLGLAGRSTLENLDTSLAGSDTRPGGKAALGQLALTLEEFELSGGATPAWQTRADLDIANLSARTSDETMATFSLGGLGIKGLGRDANDRINVDEADLSDLAFAFTDQLITAFSDPESDDDGKAAKTPQEDEPAPLNLRLGRLALAPGSTIQFTDTSVEPIARFDASIKKATVENFDTEAPSENTAIDFQVEFNETSEVSLSGWMAPLKEPLGFDIEGHMEQVALPDFSPYIAKLSGVNIETGQLNSDISALTDAKDLKGKLGVVISDLDLSSASDDTSQTFQADYGVPLELAISLLEDNEGKIALEFPIGGEVGAPKIGYADVIKAALRGVLTAFFPSFDFGTDTLDVRLDPIIFSAGERELDDAGRSLSQQIANLLNEKPKLSVKICGKATGADFLATEDAPGKAAIFDGEEQTDEEPQAGVPTSADEKQIAAEEVILTEAQAERMLDIATARTSAARSYMIEQAGISADRIGKCRVSYSIKDDKPPRVEVRF